MLHSSGMTAGRKTVHSFSFSAALAGSHVTSQRSAEGVCSVLTHGVHTSTQIFQREKGLWRVCIEEGKYCLVKYAKVKPLD